MIKHINVKPETHKEVDKVRAEEGLKTFDEAIKSLLARPDFTQDELLQLRKLIWGGYEPSEEDCKNIQSAEMKISELIYKNELTECLDDRCKEGRKAGEEFKKKLVEPVIVHNKVDDGPTGVSGDVYGVIRNSKCLSEADAEKANTKLKEYFKRQEEAEKEWRDEMNKSVVKALIDGAEDRKNDH